MIDLMSLLKSKRFLAVVSAVLSKLFLAKFGYEAITADQIVVLSVAFWLGDGVLPIDLTKLKEGKTDWAVVFSDLRVRVYAIGMAMCLVVPRLPVLLKVESPDLPTAESIWPVVLAFAAQMTAEPLRAMSQSIMKKEPNRE